MPETDTIIQLAMGIGVVGAFGISFRLYRMMLTTYASKEEMLRIQIDSLKALHSVELEKKDLEVKKLQDAYDRAARVLDKRIFEASVAVKYYLAYDMKDFSADERRMLDKYVDELEDIVGSAPATTNALPALVQIHLKLHNEEKAIYYQRLMVDAESEVPEHLRHLSHVYHVFGRYEDAIKVAKKALQLNDSDSRAVYEIGICYQMMASSKPRGSADQVHLDKKARDYYIKCLELDPEYVTAEIMMALVLHRLGEVSSSSELVRTLDGKMENGELVHREIYAYGCLLAQMNASTKAVEMLKKSIAAADSKNKVLLANTIMSDTDLNPIRKSQDFQDLIAHIKKIGKEHVG